MKAYHEHVCRYTFEINIFDFYKSIYIFPTNLRIREAEPLLFRIRHRLRQEGLRYNPSVIYILHYCKQVLTGLKQNKLTQRWRCHLCRILEPFSFPTRPFVLIGASVIYILDYCKQVLTGQKQNKVALRWRCHLSRILEPDSFAPRPLAHISASVMRWQH